MEVWTPFTIKMSTVKDYEIVKTFINKLWDILSNRDSMCFYLLNTNQSKKKLKI
jgi:hypothetical protein